LEYEKTRKIKKIVLSKKTGWIILAILVFLGAFLDVRRGAEGNPLWHPNLNYVGI